MRAGGPSEPEEADGEEGGADDHGDETLLGDGLAAVLGHFSRVPRLGCVGYNAHGDDDTDGDGQEGEGADAEVPAALLLEGDGVGFEKEVEDAVDEGHVDGDEDEDGFGEEHFPGAVEVFLGDFGEVDGVLVDGGVDGPIFGFETAGGGAALEDDWGVGFVAEEEAGDARDGGHDEGEPGGPSPAEMALREEASCDGTGYGADESGTGEEAEGEAALDGVPEVAESAADDC